ncbi:hypothetical protein BYT27DRAFT_7056244, partial [Phlegmacium glaucopus]
RSRPTRSPSLGHSTTRISRNRSLSPIISFHPAPLSAENTKGVKNITRKVIKRLEGLGHLETVDIDLAVSEDEEEPEKWSSKVAVEVEEREVEKVLYALGREAVKRDQSNTTRVGNGITQKKATKLKANLEIPRKILHGSIGFFTLYLYISEGDVRTIILVLWMALAVIIPADLLRFKSRMFARLYERFLGFLMRESERDSINGVVWYILGVNFALTFYPQDVATVAILILSWADTAASTIGRLYGSSTPKLPSSVPFLRLPLAPRKSLAGFLAASVTGACIAFGFWGWVAGMRNGGRDVVWSWDGGVRSLAHANGGLGAGGPLGLSVIAVVAGVISGVAEALDLGSIDDNLSLPIISGCFILGFIKVLGLAANAFSTS